MRLVTHKSILVECKPQYMSHAPQYEATMVDRDEIDATLRDIDYDLLDLLEQHPCTRQYLAEQTGVTGEYVYQRLTQLMNLGLVDKIHDGFYEEPGWRDDHESEE